MKKVISIALVLFVLSSVFLFNIGKAEASGINHPMLTATLFVPGKGITFVFDISGLKVRAPNLKGSQLFVHSNVYPISCFVNRSSQTISCTVRGGLTEFAGEQGSVSLMGRSYAVIIPDFSAPAKPCVECCIECEAKEAFSDPK